jgi:hypothetical protein
MTHKAPIVLTGLDHSGKTPLRIALDRHPALVMVRRLDLWTNLRRSFEKNKRARGRSTFARDLTRAASRHGLDADQLIRASGAGSFADLVAEIGRQLCAQAGARHWGVQEATLELSLTSVLADMPNARIVQVVRDPRDRAARMRRLGSLGRTGVAAETAAWIASTLAGHAAAAQYPENVLIVRYETLMGDPSATLEALCAFVGESYSEKMLNDGPLSTRDRVELLAEMGAYSTALTPREIELIESRATNLMAMFGYVATPVTRRNSTLGGTVVDPLRWYVGRLAWWLRARQMRRQLS